MKIVFEEDGSFLELLPSDDNKMVLVLCWRESYNKTKMASVELSQDQVYELSTFLSEKEK